MVLSDGMGFIVSKLLRLICMYVSTQRTSIRFLYFQRAKMLHRAQKSSERGMLPMQWTNLLAGLLLKSKAPSRQTTTSTSATSSWRGSMCAFSCAWWSQTSPLFILSFRLLEVSLFVWQFPLCMMCQDSSEGRCGCPFRWRQDGLTCTWIWMKCSDCIVLCKDLSPKTHLNVFG